MSETKICPYCKEKVKIGALKCKYCSGDILQATAGKYLVYFSIFILIYMIIALIFTSI